MISISVSRGYTPANAARVYSTVFRSCESIVARLLRSQSSFSELPVSFAVLFQIK